MTRNIDFTCMATVAAVLGVSARPDPNSRARGDAEAADHDASIRAAYLKEALDHRCNGRDADAAICEREAAAHAPKTDLVALVHRVAGIPASFRAAAE